jgi:hypothetical protein
VNLYRNEALVDETSYPLIWINFGFQPSTSSSSRGGAEIKEYRATFHFGIV